MQLNLGDNCSSCASEQVLKFIADCMNLNTDPHT